jgi:hypothetical protein
MLCSLALGHVVKYSPATCTLAPFSFAPTSFDITLTFTALHPESNGYFLFFLEDYKQDQDFELSSEFFKMAFQCMLHLSVSGHFGIFFDTFETIFTLKIQQVDTANCSNFVHILHKITFYPKLHTSLEQPTS